MMRLFKSHLPSVRIGSSEYVIPLESNDEIIDDLTKKEHLVNKNADIQKLQLCLKTGQYVVDAGCHIGTKTLYLAEYERYRFISIDGCPESIACLKESTKRNKLGKFIQPVQAVLSHSNFLCSFDRQTNENSIITKPISFWKSLFSKKAKRYKTKTLDQIIGDRVCGVIKIDVGGYELSVLHGAIQTIKRDSPNLLLNFDSKNASLESILDLLDELDYEAFYMNVHSSTSVVYKVDKSCKDCRETFMMCFHKDDPKRRFVVEELEGVGV